MSKFILCTPAVVALFFLSSCRPSAKSELNQHDIAFIKKAREAGLAEITAARVAASASKNPRIIAFAKMLIDDYNGELAKLNELHGAGLENNKDSISPAHKLYITNIGKLKGTAFDSSYMNSELDNTQAVLMIYVNAMQDKDDSLYSAEHTAAPVIQAQIDSAKSILTSVK
jgi:putative membrane protein